MIPNPTVLNEDVQEENLKYYTSSYTSIKQLLSVPPIVPAQHCHDKSKSYFNGPIDSLAGQDVLLEAIQNNDEDKIKEILQETDRINLHTIMDSRKYTLLHIAAYNNNFIIFRDLIEHVKKQYKQKAKQMISTWVNKQTEDGFSAFHFASYRGNIDMLSELEKNGANLFTLNNQGMNGLHIAAQGDQPKSIVFFRKIGLDFKQKDQKGGTALHWAGYYGCEQAMNYLLSFSDMDIDVQDHEGYSALHLASMTGNARIIKKLLLKGANQWLRCLKGLLAADIAQENQFQGIHKMLTSGQNCVVSYFSISQSFKKVERSLNQLLKFMAMLIYCVGVTIYMLITRDDSLYIYYIICQVPVIVLFLALWRSNPGYLVDRKQYRLSPQDKTIKLYQLLLMNDCSDVCPECVIPRAPRSKHCDTCKQCVQVYDHHCPWVDNCIGSGNHFIFYLFIISLTINITITLAIIITLMVLYDSNDHNNNQLHITTEYTLMSVAACIMGLFLIPIWFLCCIQTKNLLVGLTTYERYSTSSSRRSSKEASQYYSCHNCYIMCFINKRNPRLTQDRKGQSLQLQRPLIEYKE